MILVAGGIARYLKLNQGWLSKRISTSLLWKLVAPVLLLPPVLLAGGTIIIMVANNHKTITVAIMARIWLIHSNKKNVSCHHGIVGVTLAYT